MRLFVGTRKGLFIYAHSSAGWTIEKRGFLGDPVLALLPDGRDGKLYAALALGHFGNKLHRSDDNGDSWQEVTTPSYPAKPAEHPDPTPWSLEQIWSLEAGGDDQPGRIWCGTIPGGLFRSDDAGMSWSLNQALWEEPKRGLWQGGGYDWPGIHSIVVDPRNSQHITVGRRVDQLDRWATVLDADADRWGDERRLLDPRHQHAGGPIPVGDRENRASARNPSDAPTDGVQLCLQDQYLL